MVRRYAVFGLALVVALLVAVMARQRLAGSRPSVVRLACTNMVPAAVSGDSQVESPKKHLARSPRGGVTYRGHRIDGTPFAFRFKMPVREPVTPVASNEIAAVYRQIEEAYNSGDLEKMRLSILALPDAATNMPDRLFGKLSLPVHDILMGDFLNPNSTREFKTVQDFELYAKLNVELATFWGNVFLKREYYDGPVAFLDCAVLEKLQIYKRMFQSENLGDCEKCVDGFIDRWHDQIELPNGFLRQFMWFEVDLQWRRYNEGLMTAEQLSKEVKEYAKGIIHLGYTPKWLSEFDDLSEAVK